LSLAQLANPSSRATANCAESKSGSYGDAEVAKGLIEAGADLAATASADAGGVPGGTALRHAAVFGMADVAQVLVAAGATDLVQAAAAGDITPCLPPRPRNASGSPRCGWPPSTAGWTLSISC